MSPRRLQQTVIAVLLLVVLATQWPREPNSEQGPASAAPTGAAHSEQPIAETPANAVAPQSTSGVTARPSAQFDFYVLALSWSPTHCASAQGQGRDDELQCRSGRPYGFVLHGLWPQNERGYPESCETTYARRVSDDVMEDALKLSPSRKLVQHEWEKHGTCSGLSQDDYFATAALAVDSVKLPKTYRSPQDVQFTSGDAVRNAFINANRDLPKDGILVTCRRNEIGEVRICLDKDLAPRSCSREVLRTNCGTRKARMRAVRGHWPQASE